MRALVGEADGEVESTMTSDWPLLSASDMLGRPRWQARAACRSKGVDLFFSFEAPQVRLARMVCNRCPVEHECLRYAMDRPALQGVWGGTSERVRRAMRRDEVA
jgi:WhiB family redox-sensing transcriptional regulator